MLPAQGSGRQEHEMLASFAEAARITAIETTLQRGS